MLTSYNCISEDCADGASENLVTQKARDAVSIHVQAHCDGQVRTELLVAMLSHIHDADT